MRRVVFMLGWLVVLALAQASLNPTIGLLAVVVCALHIGLVDLVQTGEQRFYCGRRGGAILQHPTGGQSPQGLFVAGIDRQRLFE